MEGLAIRLSMAGGAVVAETAGVPAAASPLSRCASAGADVSGAVTARRVAGPRDPVPGTGAEVLNGLLGFAAIVLRCAAATRNAADVVGASAAVCDPLPSSGGISMLAKGVLLAASLELPVAATARNTPGLVRFASISASPLIAEVGCLPASLETSATLVAAKPLCPGGRSEASRGNPYFLASCAGLLAYPANELQHEDPSRPRKPLPSGFGRPGE